jgi:hypothetical protein
VAKKLLAIISQEAYGIKPGIDVRKFYKPKGAFSKPFPPHLESHFPRRPIWPCVVGLGLEGIDGDSFFLDCSVDVDMGSNEYAFGKLIKKK